MRIKEPSLRYIVNFFLGIGWGLLVVAVASAFVFHFHEGILSFLLYLLLYLTLPIAIILFAEMFIIIKEMHYRIADLEAQCRRKHDLDEP